LELAVVADLRRRVGGEVKVRGPLLDHRLQQLVQGRRHSGSTPFEEMPREAGGATLGDVTFFVGWESSTAISGGRVPRLTPQKSGLGPGAGGREPLAPRWYRPRGMAEDPHQEEVLGKAYDARLMRRL